ncbi:hypothetical protein [Limisphaera sp. VF-2]|uniref:hypothetical protein n=1 Tax=Limisphaera sp. VF-2 TaxID=3400418 RepID=UPI001750232A|nr:hypothetical protein [Limisphaera sp.]
MAGLIGANNSLVSTYAWGLDLNATIGGTGGVGGWLWVQLACGPPPGTHFVTCDGNGNAGQLFSASTGTETGRSEYGPFGEPIRLTGPMARENLFRFSTKRTHDTIDLVLYEYRVYSPSTGVVAKQRPHL